jgi:thiamine pyrophosphate-dependent acetolactate synthase large subunit-like protein
VTQARRIPEMVREAFTTALAPRRGPVALNLPRDLLAATIEREPAALPQAHRASVAACADPELVRLAAELLGSARRPLIIAGGGVKGSRSHLQAIALAERLGAPIAMSPGHGDAIPCDDPLYAGQVGPRGNPVASALAKEADVILALGTRLGFNTTFYSYENLNREARIIQVEQEPTAVGRFFPVALGIVGDAGQVAVGIAEALGAHEPSREVREHCARFRAERQRLLAEREAAGAGRGDPIQPAMLYEALARAVPRDAMFTMDAGTLCLQATDRMPYREPPSLFTPLDFGLVGFSYAAGLGVKLACPQRTVVSLMGDGGFGMTASEIGTAVANRIDTVCIVMNNGCWGAEKAYQRDFFGGRYIGADIPNPPYDKLAELHGAAGFRIGKAAQLDSVLREAFSCGKPAIVDVQVDPAALYSFRRDSFQHRAKAGG